MKVLVDTSVWSLALKRRKMARLSDEEHRLQSALLEAIQDGRVVMIGPIRQELLSGIREPTLFAKLKSASEPYRDEALEIVDYEEAARFYNACRSKGVECGPIDILICAVAVRRNWKVLANDLTLSKCLKIVEELSSTRA
jgi:predicted nucleic acid-binding protein